MVLTQTNSILYSNLSSSFTICFQNFKISLFLFAINIYVLYHILNIYIHAVEHVLNLNFLSNWVAFTFSILFYFIFYFFGWMAIGFLYIRLLGSLLCFSQELRFKWKS